MKKDTKYNNQIVVFNENGLELNINFDYDNDAYLPIASYDLFILDAICFNVFDFPYISNEIYAITMQELTRSRPLLQTDKRMLINPTPDKDIPASIYIDDKLYMNITPDNKRPTELK